MPADVALRKDGHCTAGLSHTPGIGMAFFIKVEYSEHTNHSKNALLPLLKLVKPVKKRLVYKK